MNSFTATNIRTGTAADLKTALVTGSTGLLGHAVCCALRDDGWRIALSGRNEVALKKLARTLGDDAIPLPCDLSLPEAGASLAHDASEAMGAPHLFIHLASLPVKPVNFLESASDLDQQIAVNAKAFLQISAALLPEMLRTQTGVIISMLSKAMLPPTPPGWQAYTIAKAAQAQAAAEITARYSEAGIRVFGIIPGIIAGETGLPGAAPISDVEKLGTPIPATRIADTIIDLINNDTSPTVTAISINENAETTGFLGFSFNQEAVPELVMPQSDTLNIRLAKIIQTVLKLPKETELTNAELGVLSGWDSLGHIKLIMEIESQFNIVFNTEESTNLTSFSSIRDALARRGIT